MGIGPAGRSGRRLALLGLAAGLLLGGLPAPAAGGPPRPVPCPFQAPAGFRIDCRILELPERHDDPKGKTVQIFLAITRADGPAPLSDPVLVLAGGPGQAASDRIGWGWAHLAALRRSRDIVYVDQRGTGRSLPSLSCPELDPLAFWHGDLTAADAGRCRARIEAAGADLADFNSEESVADLVAIRMALGIPAWNLLATSYGTVLAMELVRRDEAAVRSVVLNSPTTLRASWLDLERMAAVRAVWRRLFAACAADAACNRACPELERVFLDLARTLTARPLPVTTRDPRTGRTVTTTLNFAQLLDILTVLLGTGTGAEQVPALLWRMRRLAQTPPAPAAPQAPAPLFAPVWHGLDRLAYGLNATIGCRETWPWLEPGRLRQDGAAFRPYVMPEALAQDYAVFCPAWHLPRGPEALRRPVTSPVPALLLTGDFDTLTPTTLAEPIAATLPNAQLLRLPGLGHDPLSASACARAATIRFIESPREPLTLPCLQTPRVPDFGGTGLR